MIKQCGFKSWEFENKAEEQTGKVLTEKHILSLCVFLHNDVSYFLIFNSYDSSSGSGHTKDKLSK